MNNRIRTILGLYVCIVSFLLVGAISARPGYWLKSGNNIIYTDGSVGITGTRISKIWATDLEVTNAIVGAVTGNAATVTNATLTTALTVNTGTVTLTGNAANTSALTLGAGASSLSGANTGDQTISDATISITDVTTNNVSITAHGFAPKGTNTGATFLRDDCTWAAPAGAGNVSKVGTPVDNQVGVWTGDGTIEGTNNLTYNGANLLMTGEIGATGTRITKAWLTNLTVTNAIAGSITGNAGTVTTIAGLAPNTATTAAAQPNITSLGTLTELNVAGIISISTECTIRQNVAGNLVFSDEVTGAKTLAELDYPYISRGSSSATDLTLTTDGAWHDWDISAITGAKKSLIHLTLFFQDGTVGNYIKFRTKGFTGTSNQIQAYVIADLIHCFDYWVETDSNGFLQYLASNTTWTYCVALIRGYK